MGTVSPINSSFLDGAEEITEDKIVGTIQRGLVTAHNAGAKLTTMARVTGLSPNTVSRYMYGETTYPRWHTTLVLAHYLGFRFVMRRG